jgi:hypothetical protein
VIEQGGEDGAIAHTLEGAEFLDIDAVGLTGFGVGDIGEPFEFGRHFGQIAILRLREHASRRRRRYVPDLYQLIWHTAAPVFPAPLFRDS